MPALLMRYAFVKIGRHMLFLSYIFQLTIPYPLIAVFELILDKWLNSGAAGSSSRCEGFGTIEQEVPVSITIGNSSSFKEW